MQNNTPKKTKYLCWKQKPFLLRLRSTGRLFPLSFSHSSQMLYIARIQMLHLTFDNLLSPSLLWKTSASPLNENFMHSKHNTCISHALKTDQNVCWHCSTQSDSHFIQDRFTWLPRGALHIYQNFLWLCRPWPVWKRTSRWRRRYMSIDFISLFPHKRWKPSL